MKEHGLQGKQRDFEHLVVQFGKGALSETEIKDCTKHLMRCYMFKNDLKHTSEIKDDMSC